MCVITGTNDKTNQKKCSNQGLQKKMIAFCNASDKNRLMTCISSKKFIEHVRKCHKVCDTATLHELKIDAIIKQVFRKLLINLRFVSACIFHQLWIWSMRWAVSAKKWEGSWKEVKSGEKGSSINNKNAKPHWSSERLTFCSSVLVSISTVSSSAPQILLEPLVWFFLVSSTSKLHPGSAAHITK